MNEEAVRTMICELASRQVPHLTDAIAHVITEYLLVRQPADAVVLNIETARTMAWGTCHEFSSLGSVEVYR